MIAALKKLGVDWHSVSALLAGGAGFCLNHYNSFMGGVAATATAVYMVYKAAAERRKFRREKSPFYFRNRK